ncbi:MAG: carboxypeptidase-like regulatory domain-containing protein, partial [Tannerella sp.]|nr:carboxypeptidase-like regulatory domain-containing protein [Tannerella sp.]
MTKVIYFLLIVVFSPFFIFAQDNNPFKIEGKVIDRQTKEPVIGATVSLADHRGGTVSDEEGAFSLTVQSVPAALTVSYVGYKSLNIDIYEVSESIIIELIEDQSILEEIVITGYTTQQRKAVIGA